MNGKLLIREELMSAANGRWLEILPALKIPEEFLRNARGPCPICAGKDRFRLDNKDGRGTYFCNQGDIHHPDKKKAGDGFALLANVHGWSVDKAFREVADYLGMDANDQNSEAKRLWDQARPASPNHPYLLAKKIAAHGAQQLGDCLVVSVESSSGEVVGLQYIRPNGTKKFLKGTAKIGNLYWIGATPPDEDNRILICEGFATGASLHQATNCCVVVAFDAGNLLPVAERIRSDFPVGMLVLCADDDYQTTGNPGLAKARAAALAVGGLLAVPDFGEDRPDRASDFNDLHQHRGIDVVRACVDAAKPALQQQANQGAAELDPESSRFGHAGGEFVVGRQGVFFANTNDNMWICSTLRVVAMARDGASGEWGRLLEWVDDDRVPHSWAMPMELLQGDGSDLRRELARQGLALATTRKAQQLLTAYLSVWPVARRARCVPRLGWCGPVYVRPEETIGYIDETVVFQSTSAVIPSLAIAGTVEQWRYAVAAKAEGNSRLVLALCVAFAGPLVDIAGEDGGGFHFRGASSSGKTTALHMAASVYGNPRSYIRLWRATTNGLEGVAALHNDGLLILDELGQINPREAGEAAYMLANGQGKARASRSGSARDSARWRLLLLSAGEVSLADQMALEGRKASAGQEIRLADIESDAGAKMGLFEELHGYASPTAFSLAIKDDAAQYHGAVGLEWIRRLVADRAELTAKVAASISQFVTDMVPAGASGQVQRVARRFGLAAVAGELATGYGLTGWHKGEALQAARVCFDCWLVSFGGTGNREVRALVEQVRAFFEAHGASRFENVASPSAGAPIRDRVGFSRLTNRAEREYLVLPEAFKNDVCKGFDKKFAEEVLVSKGWLVQGGDCRTTRKERIPAMGAGSTRVYVLRDPFGDDENGGSE